MKLYIASGAEDVFLLCLLWNVDAEWCRGSLLIYAYGMWLSRPSCGAMRCCIAGMLPLG